MMNNIFNSIRNFLADRFNLQEDKGDETEIVGSIRKNVSFTGANLWALIFAIFIASIGLNVNSIAVIIGAMLISPIMGPVMGIGLGVGINDIELVKKGAKNLLVATIIGVLASAAYFLITPLNDVQSQLLARTSPSLFDVFIAFFGGGAGMVAASRKEKSNVIPGVAIATALMPPLCTAGFGLATENWLYFLGAIYLYFINSVFIAIATYLVARYLRMQKVQFDNDKNQKRVTTYILVIVTITILPSIYMAYRIVNRSIFQSNAQRFVKEQFKYDNTQVVSKTYHYSRKEKTIDLLLVGKELDKTAIDSLNKNLLHYKLKGVHLNIRQGLNASHQIDFSQIKASILEDVYSKTPKQDTVRIALKPIKVVNRDTAVFSELKVLYPAIRSFGINKIAIHRIGILKTDTTKIALIKFKHRIKAADRVKLQLWLRARYESPSLSLIVR